MVGGQDSGVGTFAVTPRRQDGHMSSAQLQLVPPAPASPWRLSTETRRIGRAGIAEARAALASRAATDGFEAEGDHTLPFAA